jgi:hypothetical protein
MLTVVSNKFIFRINSLFNQKIIELACAMPHIGWKKNHEPQKKV